MAKLLVRRSDLILEPDAARVLLRPFMPGGEERARRVLAHLTELDEEEVDQLYSEVIDQFGGRHRQIEQEFRKRYAEIKRFIPDGRKRSRTHQLLIAAYFTMEYSLESAALFNPSMIPHPDQTDLTEGAVRFMLSLRAVGEGHLSSIEFRSGEIDPDGRIRMGKPAPFVIEARKVPDRSYEKKLFRRKLKELGLENDFSEQVLAQLGDSFPFSQLHHEIEIRRKQDNGNRAVAETTAEGMISLAKSNYAVNFPPDSRASSRVLFPSSPTQKMGLEDARFTLFETEDGEHIYYATFTAFDGRLTLPQILETRDFLHFRISTLNGPAVQNKGMALFPRKINGSYAMISRQDGERIFLMYSDNVNFWYEPQLLLEPSQPWDIMQIGNCGSPIEIDEGWLVLSHGVGPMRRYCIGAFLLDRDDPSKVIGRLKEPLLEPRHNEREGYVPNVVYSCGAMLHGDRLVIPYAMADYASSFATVELARLLDAMK